MAIRTVVGTIPDGSIGAEKLVEPTLASPLAEPATFAGDGSTLSFDLAHAQIAQATVFVDGIAQPPGIWSISAGTGAGGVDQLVFGAGSAPASGADIEVNYITEV